MIINNKPDLPIPGDNKLYYPHCYGTAAYDIYLWLCKKFGFFEVLADNFKINEVLFACNATPEKYDVWFLAHSNWNGSKTTNWKNVIVGDGELIEEYFLGMDYEFERMDLRKYKRLVFVNMSDGRYMFLGIYEPVSIDYFKKMRTYKLVSYEYPY